MADDAFMFLLFSAKEAGYVNEAYDRNIEGITESDESGCLTGSVAVESACQDSRLVGDNASGTSVHMSESHYDILCPGFVHLKEFPVIHDVPDDLMHVIGLAWIVRND